MRLFGAEYNFTLYKYLVFKAGKNFIPLDQLYLINLKKKHPETNHKKNPNM